jgi:hypothetical protein
MRFLALFALAAAMAATPGPSPTPAFRQPVPEKSDPAARFLIYLHGRIIEERGIRPTDPRYGTYEYVAIVRALERKGFTVVTEARPSGTDPERYAQTVKGQVEALLSAGVPARHITVLGASKGALIAMLASTATRNRDVNFVLMSNCNDWVREHFRIDLYGNVLSIYDRNDEFGTTCGPIFAHSNGLARKKEVVLQLGTGHAVLYQPLPEWINLVDSWAREATEGERSPAPPPPANSENQRIGADPPIGVRDDTDEATGARTAHRSVAAGRPGSNRGRGSREGPDGPVR